MHLRPSRRHRIRSRNPMIDFFNKAPITSYKTTEDISRALDANTNILLKELEDHNNRITNLEVKISNLLQNIISDQKPPEYDLKPY